NQLAISQRESIERASKGNGPRAENEMKSEVGILSCTYSSQVIFEKSMLTCARAETAARTIEERTSPATMGVRRMIQCSLSRPAKTSLPNRALMIDALKHSAAAVATSREGQRSLR